jgi:cold shock CspA family protein
MFGKITYWNQPKGFGFITVTEQASPFEQPYQQQYFFHHSNFTKCEVPLVGAFVMLRLGEPFADGKKVQAVGVRFATANEIAQRHAGASALANTTQEVTTIEGVQVVRTTVNDRGAR